jgi:hypothetical protein
VATTPGFRIKSFLFTKRGNVYLSKALTAPFESGQTALKKETTGECPSGVFHCETGIKI